jgi:N6-L-threonylcarbamoyladenine synthase
VEKAAKESKIKEIAIAGGVSANSCLRGAIIQFGERNGWNVYIPEFRFTTDNAAMIAIVGYYKYLKGEFSEHDVIPLARFPL